MMNSWFENLILLIVSLLFGLTPEACVAVGLPPAVATIHETDGTRVWLHRTAMPLHRFLWPPCRQ